jgi:hypothetical protein
MTGLYNVLEKLKSGAALTPAERDIHDAGQVSILHRLHEALDAAVAEAYDWPVALPANQVVAKVVALNLARQAEEQAGLVRWLRPGFQAPTDIRHGAQTALPVTAGNEALRPRWPTRDPKRFVALRAVLAATPGRRPGPAFERATAPKVRDMLATLVALGRPGRARMADTTCEPSRCRASAVPEAPAAWPARQQRRQPSNQ